MVIPIFKRKDIYPLEIENEKKVDKDEIDLKMVGFD